MAEIWSVVWEKLGSVPAKIQTVGTLVVAALFGLVSIAEGAWASAAFALGLITSVVLAALALAKESSREAVEQQLTDLQAVHAQCSSEMEAAARRASDDKDEQWSEYIDFLCRDRLNLLLHKLSECFTSTIAHERQAKIATARTAILHATPDLVGNSDKGTRANIFRLTEDENGEVMEPEASWGRGPRSIREFRPDSETFKAAKRKESRFVAVTDPDSSDEKLDYETYLTYPIEDGTGQLYGLLTVDCLKVGELAMNPDRGKMSVLAAMLALTYRAEGLRITSIST